jgi:exonuclease V
MASNSTEECTGNSVNDYETDYGSDFSPEEEEILFDLASRGQRVETEDNPIVTKPEHNEEQALRIPRALGRDPSFALLQAAQAADAVAERIRTSVATDGYSDCKETNLPLQQQV